MEREVEGESVLETLSVAQGRVIGGIITSNPYKSFRPLESISGFHAVGFRDLLSLSYPSVLPFGPKMTHGEESRSQLQGLQKLAICALPTKLRSLLQQNKE